MGRCGYCIIMVSLIQSRTVWYNALVFWGIYTVMARIGVPWCGVSTANTAWSLMVDGVWTVVTVLYAFRSTPIMTPPDLRLVSEVSLAGVCINLYLERVFLHIDLIWPCLVSVRHMRVGFSLLSKRLCRSRIVECIPLTLNMRPVICGCEYGGMYGCSSK